MQEIIINKNESGQRFDKYLQKYFKEAGSGFIYKMLRKKNIELNGKKASGNEKLNDGDIVMIFMSDDTIKKFRGEDKKTPIENRIETKNVTAVEKIIVYEDENIILANKPAGVLSQKSSPKDISLNEMIIDYLLHNKKITGEELKTFKPSICNRLDRNTTGLISFGKSLKGIQELSYGFKERTFDKYYLAVVWGNVTNSKTIEGYLVKHEKTNTVKIEKNTSDKSSYIKTYYEPLKHSYIEIDGKRTDITLLKIKLITGKTHQIRAHLSSIGHSILGDDKYGIIKNNIFLKKYMKVNYQLLHSYELTINDNENLDALKQLRGKHFFAEPGKVYYTLFEKNDRI